MSSCCRQEEKNPGWLMIMLMKQLAGLNGSKHGFITLNLRLNVFSLCVCTDGGPLVTLGDRFSEGRNPLLKQAS